MDDSIIIKQRSYDKFQSEITKGLKQYLKNPEWQLTMVRSGVTVDDTYEMITVTCCNSTYVSFKVTRDDLTVVKVFPSLSMFDKNFGIFYPKDRKLILDFLKSYEGLSIDLSKEGDEIDVTE